MLNLFTINKSYVEKNNSLELELVKAYARIEELTNLTNRQADTIIDLCVTNSSAELIGAELETLRFETIKWQNKYIELINRSLDKVPAFKEDDRIEAGEEAEKEPINQKTPWHIRRKQLENEDRAKANEMRRQAEIALSNKPPSVEVLAQAAQELENEFAAGEQS